MQCIAKKTMPCLVCGAEMAAGLSLIRYSPAVPGSERHAECYGKRDNYAPTNEHLDTANAGDGPEESKAVPGSNSEPAQQQGEQPPPPEPQPSKGKPEPNTAAEGEQDAAPKPDDSQIQALMDKLQEQLDASAALDELKEQFEALDKQVQELSKEPQVVDLTVKLPDATVEMGGLQHYLTPKLLKLMSVRDNIYMWGPAGGGKSSAVRKCAEALSLPFYYISLNPQSSPTRIEGYQTPHGEYVMTLFRKAYEFGGVFTGDEADNASPNLWTSINNAIDSDLGSFPDGMVKRHPDFIFVGTGNTNLRGDALYRDRRPQDPAVIDRFSFLEWGYDERLEAKVALGINPQAKGWVAFIHTLRRWAKQNNPELWKNCTPRATFKGALHLGVGFPLEEVLDMVLWKGAFDASSQKAVLTAVPPPKESMSLAAAA